MSLALQVFCDELKYLTKLKGDSGIFQPWLYVYVFQCVKMKKGAKGFILQTLVISPVCDVFISPQTKVDNACLVGVGYTQTLRPGKLIVCFFFRTILCNNNPKTLSIVT